ncbi:MAG: S9 family peptidase [Bacteroidales bacterium]|nr:S9 family peptidase [Bacteroidales bacterium]
MFHSRTLILGLLTVLSFNFSQIDSASQSKSFELQDIIAYKYWPKSAGTGFRSLPDGKHYTILSPDRTKILKCDYATGEVTDTLFDTATAREADFKAFDDYLISDNGLQIVILRETEPIYRRSKAFTAYHYDVRRNLVSPLNKTPGKVRIPTFSPNGRMVAYVLNNDVYIKKIDYDTEVRVTTDGKVNEVMNGVTDWVYEEELYLTNTLTWSEDSKYLTFMKTDESKVRMFGMTIYGEGNYPSVYGYKYPKAGEDNSVTSIVHYNVDNRSSVSLLEDVLKKEELYLPKMEYHGGTLYVCTLNRNQNHLRVYQVNPDSHVAKLWMQHKDDKYIDTNSWVLGIKITDKGTYYVSDESGRPQIYLYGKGGARERQLTSGDYDVTEVYGVAGDGEVFYQVAAPTPMDRQLRATNLKGETRILSPNGGTADAVFSSNMVYYLEAYSSISDVPRYSVHSSKDGKEVVLLEDNRELKSVLDHKALAGREFVEIDTQSGQKLNALITYPVSFDKTKKYPVVMTQYSGPGSQTALNAFRIDWEQVLAQDGFIVVSVDGRGTGGRGREFLKCTYMNLGLLESTDQIEAAQALKKLPYVDGDRIGIWGWSFGGYTSLMCMARGKGTFRAGIAVAPPTDWRLYDSIYTERYMRTPGENKSGYDAASVMNHISGLEGELLIIHGTADDNVHFQNTMKLVPALVNYGKHYSMLVYPDQAHGISYGKARAHVYAQFVRFFKQNLQD